MREVIETLVVAEGEARRIVQGARAEAEGIVSDARKAAGALSTKACAEARRDARQTVDAAIEAAQQEKRRRQDIAVAKMECQVRLDRVMKDSLVETVVRCISGNR